MIFYEDKIFVKGFVVEVRDIAYHNYHIYVNGIHVCNESTGGKRFFNVDEAVEEQRIIAQLIQEDK